MGSKQELLREKNQYYFYELKNTSTAMVHTRKLAKEVSKFFYKEKEKLRGIRILL